MNEATVEVGETKEDLNVFDGGGRRPIENGGDLFGIHSNAVASNDVA